MSVHDIADAVVIVILVVARLWSHFEHSTNHKLISLTSATADRIEAIANGRLTALLEQVAALKDRIHDLEGGRRKRLTT